MELADFSLERLTFELRYEKAYALWDNAGALTNALVAEFPTAELHDANPAKITIFARPNAEFSVELDKAYVIHFNPRRTAEDALAAAGALTKAVTTHLAVRTYTRVGTRLIYKKGHDKLSSATESVVASGLLHVPDGRFFGVGGPPQSVAYGARFEGKATGVHFRLLSQSERFEVNPAPVHSKEMQRVTKEQHEVVLDIDYYSTVPVLQDQFRADEWLKNVVHLVNRDSKAFLKSR